MEIKAIRTPSLGNTTYVMIHDGTAVVVDPQRDIGRFVDVIAAANATVTYVLETHMHNDYVSGGKALAAKTGADLVIPAGSGATFPFVPAFHNEELGDGNGLVLRPLHTPGHTPAHTSYLALVEGEAIAVFTGGSLLVGATGRSDLLGEEMAHQLAILQYGSLQRLATLPDATDVLPTHGAGSFCSASAVGRAASTIGEEKASNPAYQFIAAEDFASAQQAALVPYPSYYAFMGSTNRRGPTVLPMPDVPELGPDAVEALVEAGTAVLDGRERHAFAETHIPGAIGIELGNSFAPWAGWLLEHNAPVMFVLDEGEDAAEAATELGRIGFDHVRGVLRGMRSWRHSGRSSAGYATVDITGLLAARDDDSSLQVLDVRDPMEWAAGHLEGSIHRYVPDIDASLVKEVDAGQPVWVVCRTGNRASIAAARLEELGLTPIVVTKGGVPDALDR